MLIIIGVIPDTLCLWKLNQNEPIEHHFLAIFKFLGYNPIIPEAETLGQQFKKMRLENGWTLQQAKNKLGFEIPTNNKQDWILKSSWYEYYNIHTSL